MKAEDYATAEVVPYLPGFWRNPDAYQLPPGLVGGMILGFGTLPRRPGPEYHVGGGGLVIDYRDRASGEVRRVVFSLSDQGLWTEFTGVPGAAPTPVEGR